jgi:sec-independent protein translocase protein TatA
MPTSLGPAEILVILVVALIVLGPKKLPEAGRQVGKAIAEVRKWSQGFQDEIKTVMDPDASRPTYSQPQPGYDPPPIPVIPAETAPPADKNGEGTVTTGSHGLVSGPPPADTSPTDGPPAGDAPQP